MFTSERELSRFCATFFSGFALLGAVATYKAIETPESVSHTNLVTHQVSQEPNNASEGWMIAAASFDVLALSFGLGALITRPRQQASREL